MKSLQDTYAPSSICFGCGPANKNGLQIKSITKGDEVFCSFTPEEHHQAFPGMINGGIIGSILDCHCNWTAAWHIMNRTGQDEPPCTVTAEYKVKLLKPTPTGVELKLRAWVKESSDRKATICAELTANGELCATCEGLFVAVKESHPAYHRWG